MKRMVAALALALVLFGCLQQPAGGGNGAGAANGAAAQQNYGGSQDGVDVMQVENGDTVKVEYTGTLENGEVFDKSEGRGPLEFVAGAGQMIKGFDEAVIGMKLNEDKNVTIPPEKAYGSTDSAQVVKVPVSQIGGDGNLAVGSKLYTQSGLQGTVTDINDGTATVSLVHPLAGKTLNFWIKVVGIMKAQK